MFALGVALIILGYNTVYTGFTNLRSGGHSNGWWQNLGISTTVSVDDGSTPAANLTGQPASSNPSPTAGGVINV